MLQPQFFKNRLFALKSIINNTCKTLCTQLHFAFVFFFCSVLSEKAEITSHGAYHHLHFVWLTSQGIFLFHLTKKGITIKNITVV